MFSVTYKFHSVITDGKEALETDTFWPQICVKVPMVLSCYKQLCLQLLQVTYGTIFILINLQVAVSRWTVATQNVLHWLCPQQTFDGGHQEKCCTAHEGVCLCICVCGCIVGWVHIVCMCMHILCVCVLGGGGGGGRGATSSRTRWEGVKDVYASWVQWVSVHVWICVHISGVCVCVVTTSSRTRWESERGVHIYHIPVLSAVSLVQVAPFASLRILIPRWVE